jgi:hypothetical protein
MNSTNRFGSQIRQAIYLILSIVGTILTQQANWKFIQTSSGFHFDQFIIDATNTAAAESLSWDLIIGATAVFIWMITESKRINLKYSWLPISMSIVIAFAAGAPLFMFLRERHLNKVTDKPEATV